MKTGRLIKFRRAGGSVHAYLYREAREAVAEIFLREDGAAETRHHLRGPSEEEVEAAVRAFVDDRFPGKAR